MTLIKQKLEKYKTDANLTLAVPPTPGEICISDTFLLFLHLLALSTRRSAGFGIFIERRQWHDDQAHIQDTSTRTRDSISCAD